MGYDEVIAHLGDFGRYQRRIYILLCLPAILCAFHKLAGVFLLAQPKFRCRLPFENASTATYESFPEKQWHLAYEYTNLTKKWTTCEYYDVDYNNKYLNQSVIVPNGTVKCSDFLYDRTEYAKTALTEWNMVCERSLLTSTSDACFMLGVLLGSIIFGQLSDRYGRKPIFFASLVIQVVFGITAGLAPEFITYTFSRFIVGSTTSGVFLVAYVIALELVGVPYRLFAGVIMQMFFSLGFMLIAGIAFLIRDWRWLQIALTLPGLLFMCYYWIIPESVRWLLRNGRHSEAIRNIQKVARVNGVHISDDMLNNLVAEETQKKSEESGGPTVTILDLFKHANLRRKTLLIFFDWFVNSGVYYGLSWNTNNLGGNSYVNFLISGAVEIPAYTVLMFTLNKWGRRNILCGCMLLAGTALLSILLVPPHMNWLLITLTMIGKCAITASYGTVYIFSAEQFPTVVRNAGLGASSMVARIGGILAPYLKDVGLIWRPLPMIICGALAFMGGLLSLLLPETLNKPMLETIEDGENFGRNDLPEHNITAAEIRKMIENDKQIDN